MDKKGILLYCIANEADSSIFKLSGMDESCKLYSIENSGLFAVVSNVDLEEYGEEAMALKGKISIG